MTKLSFYQIDPYEYIILAKGRLDHLYYFWTRLLWYSSHHPLYPFIYQITHLFYRLPKLPTRACSSKTYSSLFLSMKTSRVGLIKGDKLLYSVRLEPFLSDGTSLSSKVASIHFEIFRLKNNIKKTLARILWFGRSWMHCL